MAGFSDVSVVNLDALTYAGNPENLADVVSAAEKGEYRMPDAADPLAYLQRVAKKIAIAQAGPIMIADLGQPMGGPSNSGHASHQSGLDVDIWFWHPKAAEKRKLRTKERESLRARSIVDRKKKAVNRHFSDNISTMLRIAASEPEVSKIFVNPLIKFELCVSRPRDQDTSWLRKLRPWWGHHDHLHVRLRCPDKDPSCVPQAPLPEGDGCEELSWWLDDEAQAARKAGQKSYQGQVGALPCPFGGDGLQGGGRGDGLVERDAERAVLEAEAGHDVIARKVEEVVGAVDR